MNNLTNQSITGSKETTAREVNYTYYNNNKVKSVTDSAGGQITYSYDKNGNLTETKKVREGNQYDIEQFVYDDENRVIESIKVLDASDIYNSSASPIMKITYEYDQLGKLIKQTDVSGIETTYTYDELGRVKKVVKHQEIKDITISYQYDQVGNKIEEIDPKGMITTYSYDKMNRIKSITKEGTFTYAYDLAGNIRKETNAKGSSITYTYDELGRLKTTTDPFGIIIDVRTYDNKGNVVAVADAKGNATTFTYDLIGRVIKTKTKEGHETTHKYNAFGELTAQINPLGETTTYAYDAVGRLIKVTDPEGIAVSYGYDKAGNKSYMVDGRGKITKYTYGAFGLLRMATDAVRKTIKYLYDETGNLAQIEDKNGYHTMFLYNKDHQLIEKMVVETNDHIGYTYDEVGNRISMTDESGETTYTYDAYNRLLTKKNNKGLNLTYTYDVIGNITSLTDSSGRITSYTYDLAQRMETVTFGEGKITYSYDVNGNRKSITYDGGITVTYDYNKDDKLIKLTNVKPDNGVLSTYNYTYDGAGRETSKTDQYGTTKYSYDKAGRVKAVEAPGFITTYAYDQAGNRLSMEQTHLSLQESNYIDSTSQKKVQYKKKTTQYTYDNANHLLKQVEFMYDEKETNILQKTTSYLYDSNGNELSKWSNFIKPHTSTMGQTTSGAVVTVDGSSNDSGEGSPIHYVVERRNSSYDGFNKLKAVEDLSDGERKLISYTYDGDDLRVQKEVRNSKDGYSKMVTNYHYDRQHVLLETNETGAVTVAYTRGLNYISKTEQGETNFYLYNGHGDVIQTVTKAGIIKNQYDYDIFGEPILVLEEGYQNSIRYAGEFYDSETGLYYLRARYYNPQTGRFISEDSYWGEETNPLSLNLYTYCYNDPVNFIDPTGHIVTSWDKDNLNSNQIKEVEEATKAWVDANARGDRDAMNAAHDRAENARNTERNNGEIGSNDGYTYILESSFESISGSNDETIDVNIYGIYESDRGKKSSNGYIPYDMILAIEQEGINQTSLQQEKLDPERNFLTASSGDLRQVEKNLGIYNSGLGGSGKISYRYGLREELNRVASVDGSGTRNPSQEASRKFLKEMGYWPAEGTGKVYAIPLLDSTRLSQEKQEANATYIFNYLNDKGWKKEAIAGLLGNIQQESQMNPGVWQKQDNLGLGYGFVQWDDATKFLDWKKDGVKAEKLSATDANALAKSNPELLSKMQLEFLLFTCTTTDYTVREWYPTTDYDSPYKMTYNEFITSTNDVGELALVFHGSYERSSDDATRKQNRIDYANYWYEYLSK